MKTVCITKEKKLALKNWERREMNDYCKRSPVGQRCVLRQIKHIQHIEHTQEKKQSQSYSALMILILIQTQSQNLYFGQDYLKGIHPSIRLSICNQFFLDVSSQSL